ncbi:hypothetical protein MTR_1g007400 [Medicago truncatula]|uniref:Transmembrane protein n=1 Tax=Medicago truncatula TaxID=3880 RepID=G7I286_MEDTR|nr:hypothetical protein MTR_1g007400 [Medicago truncatula]
MLLFLSGFVRVGSCSSFGFSFAAIGCSSSNLSGMADFAENQGFHDSHRDYDNDFLHFPWISRFLNIL